MLRLAGTIYHGFQATVLHKHDGGPTYHYTTIVDMR